MVRREMSDDVQSAGRSRCCDEAEMDGVTPWR